MTRGRTKPRRRSTLRTAVGAGAVGVAILLLTLLTLKAWAGIRRLATTATATAGVPARPWTPPPFPAFPTATQPPAPLPPGPTPRMTITAVDPGLKGGNNVWSVAYSPDGQSLLTSDGKFVFGGHARLWEAESGQRASLLYSQDTQILGAAFQPKGRLVALAGLNHGLHLIDLDRPTAVRTLAQPGGVRGVAFSPDGKQVAAESDQLLQLWDAASGDRLGQAPVHIDAFWGGISVGLAYSPDGAVLAFPDGGKGVALLDVKTGLQTTTLAGHQGNVYCVTYRPDGLTLASGGGDKNVILWDAKKHQERKRLTEVRDAVTAVAFTPDGRLLAAACKDGGVVVWDVDGDRAPALMPIKGAAAVAFSPDGRTLAAAFGDGTVRLWDAATLFDAAGKFVDGEKKTP